MAVIVLGAGATRGASFVDPLKNPCLPPLDADFHTQLQRIRNRKHRRTIDRVIRDTVEIFGVNFRVTMETLFATLEHAERMLQTTGERRDFKTTDLKDKRQQLQQAIAAVFEEAISPAGPDQSPCSYHDALVDRLESGDTIISFNYDCVIDDSLRRRGDDKWNAHYGYGFKLARGGGANLRGDQSWSPKAPALKPNTLHLLKLHGSLHFRINDSISPPGILLKRLPHTRTRNRRFSIIPPESQKRFDEGAFAHLWKLAGRSIYQATSIVVIGYSFQPTDLHSTALFQTNTRRASLRARRRTRDVLQRALGNQTRVVVFDTMEEFGAADRTLWDT